MVDKRAEHQLPSYVPYRTWNRFLEKAKDEQPIPLRLDSSFWARLPFSGSNQSALKRALVFLGLMNQEGYPEENLEKLMTAEGEEKRRLVKEIVSRSYADLLAGVDLRRATKKQLQDFFKVTGADGKMGQQCLSFFLAIAKEAGIELHPSLQSRVVTKRTGKTVRGRKVKVSESDKVSSELPSGIFLSHEMADSLSRLHPALLGLLRELPNTGERWQQKEQWKRTLETMLDLLYPGEVLQ